MAYPASGGNGGAASSFYSRPELATTAPLLGGLFQAAAPLGRVTNPKGWRALAAA